MDSADANDANDDDDDGDIIAHNARCSLRAIVATSTTVWANRVQCISDGASGGCVYTRLVAAMNPYRSQEVARQHSAPIFDCRLPIVVNTMMIIIIKCA